MRLQTPTPQPQQPLRIVLADDHELVRCGIRTLLEAIDGTVVPAEARDGQELLQCLESTPADLVLTDLTMPGMDGFGVIKAVRERHPDTRVLVLSMHMAGHLVRRAVASGACGYLSKDAPDFELEAAVRAIATTGSYFSPAVARCLLEEPDDEPELTPRQREVLVRLAQGCSAKEIAFELGLSSRTVDIHRSRIMDRLGIGDLASLTRYALRKGLLQP